MSSRLNVESKYGRHSKGSPLMSTRCSSTSGSKTMTTFTPMLSSLRMIGKAEESPNGVFEKFLKAFPTAASSVRSLLLCLIVSIYFSPSTKNSKSSCLPNSNNFLVNNNSTWQRNSFSATYLFNSVENLRCCDLQRPGT